MRRAITDFERASRRFSRWGPFFLPAAALTALLLAALFGEHPRWRGLMPVCLFHRLTGLYCPGCGVTRAVRALLAGDWGLSLHRNALLLPMAVLLICLSFRPEWGLRRYVAFGTLILIVLFWVVRNLPFYPCTLLAPL